MPYTPYQAGQILSPEEAAALAKRSLSAKYMGSGQGSLDDLFAYAPGRGGGRFDDHVATLDRGTVFDPNGIPDPTQPGTNDAGYHYGLKKTPDGKYQVDFADYSGSMANQDKDNNNRFVLSSALTKAFLAAAVGGAAGYGPLAGGAQTGTGTGLLDATYDPTVHAVGAGSMGGGSSLTAGEMAATVGVPSGVAGATLAGAGSSDPFISQLPPVETPGPGFGDEAVKAQLDKGILNPANIPLDKPFNPKNITDALKAAQTLSQLGTPQQSPQQSGGGLLDQGPGRQYSPLQATAQQPFGYNTPMGGLLAEQPIPITYGLLGGRGVYR